jgi:hypothetical protein
MALETSLARTDLLRLTWDMIYDEEGVGVPTGGRKNTGGDQIAPLTERCRNMLAAIKTEREAAKVTNLATEPGICPRGWPTD